MVLDLIGSDVTAALLFILLILAFVIAFKVMQMVFETILVSVLSGGFYLGLVYFFNYSFTLERLLLFAFLGASLYMAYSFLISAYSIASTVIEVPYHILKPVVIFPVHLLEKTYSYLREKQRKHSPGNSSRQQSGGGEESDRDVREVVLDKVRKD